MAKIRHLNNAPIEEAIVDFGVVLPDGFSPERFGAAKPRLEPSYPIVQEHRMGGEGEEPLTLQGYLFRSKDEVTLAQFRTDGFTLNRLAPYHNWKDFRSE